MMRKVILYGYARAPDGVKNRDIRRAWNGEELKAIVFDLSGQQVVIVVEAHGPVMLALRAAALANPRATVVVDCAGEYEEALEADARRPYSFTA